MESYKQKKPSPCLTCTIVKNPYNCENKLCMPWRRWFLARWLEINRFFQKAQDECAGASERDQNE